MTCKSIFIFHLCTIHHRYILIDKLNSCYMNSLFTLTPIQVSPATPGLISSSTSSLSWVSRVWRSVGGWLIDSDSDGRNVAMNHWTNGAKSPQHPWWSWESSVCAKLKSKPPCHPPAGFLGGDGTDTLWCASIKSEQAFAVRDWFTEMYSWTFQYSALEDKVQSLRIEMTSSIITLRQIYVCINTEIIFECSNLARISALSSQANWMVEHFLPNSWKRIPSPGSVPPSTTQFEEGGDHPHISWHTHTQEKN